MFKSPREFSSRRGLDARLQLAVRLALAAVALGSGSAASGQDQSSTGNGELTEVVVTGSRIRGAEAVGSNVIAVWIAK